MLNFQKQKFKNQMVNKHSLNKKVVFVFKIWLRIQIFLWKMTEPWKENQEETNINFKKRICVVSIKLGWICRRFLLAISYMISSWPKDKRFESLPFCAKWHKASSIWRRVDAEVVWELLISQVRAPSSISRERPFLRPAAMEILVWWKGRCNIELHEEKHVVKTLNNSPGFTFGKICHSPCNLRNNIITAGCSHF